MCFSSTGKVYWKKVYELPQGGRAARGKPIVNILPLEEGENINAILAVRDFDADQYILFNAAMLSSVLPNFTSSSMQIDYIRIYQQNTLNTQEINKKEPRIKAYPNPVKDTLEIKLQNNDYNNKEVNLKFFDINGRVINNKLYQLHEDILLCNTEFLTESGVYFGKLTFNDGASSVFKFVKE